MIGGKVRACIRILGFFPNVVFCYCGELDNEKSSCGMSNTSCSPNTYGDRGFTSFSWQRKWNLFIASTNWPPIIIEMILHIVFFIWHNSWSNNHTWHANLLIWQIIIMIYQTPIYWSIIDFSNNMLYIIRSFLPIKRN